MTIRTEAQKRAEAEYRASRVQVLVRLTADEAKRFDKLRGAEPRATFARAALLAEIDRRLK
jgi:hypothetical protein